MFNPPSPLSQGGARESPQPPFTRGSKRIPPAPFHKGEQDIKVHFDKRCLGDLCLKEI